MAAAAKKQKNYGGALLVVIGLIALWFVWPLAIAGIIALVVYKHTDRRWVVIAVCAIVALPALGGEVFWGIWVAHHQDKSSSSAGPLPFTRDWSDDCSYAWDSHAANPTFTMRQTSKALWVAQCHQDQQIQNELGNTNAPVDQPVP